MATMNLLQGNIKGSMGAHTGVRAKGKNIFKARIWSKTPMSNRQRNNVRSFEKLNRISSAIAKEFFPWLGFNTRNMNPHNAVASEFKCIIKNHVFYPPALSEVIPLSNRINIEEFAVDPIAQSVKITVRANIPGINAGTQAVLVIAFDGAGKTIFCKKMQTPLLEADFKHAVSYDFPFYIMAFSSTKEKKGFKLNDLTFKMTLPENVLYTEPYTSIRWWTVEPYYLYGEGADLWTQNNTLMIQGD